MREQLFQYLVSNSGALGVEDILLNFLGSAVIALVIYITYKMSHSGTVYSVRFNVSLVMLTLVTTLVMNVIGNNIALSLGMVGALSIVRFRTAIKDPRDTAFIFWCIAAGICCGVSEFMIAGIGSAIIFLFMFLFGFVKTNDRYMVVIRGERKCADEVRRMMDEQFAGKQSLRVQNSTKETIELIYEVSSRMLEGVSKHSGRELADILYSAQGVSNVNIVCQNDELSR
ncbi:MAG: DUF4956 domain-containing protein [Clostridiales bacterium]|nr:DUF4956 domain-containing protein [Clostridiales bacterium]